MIYKLLIVINYFICLLIILISKFSKHKLRPISINHMNHEMSCSESCLEPCQTYMVDFLVTKIVNGYRATSVFHILSPRCKESIYFKNIEDMNQNYLQILPEFP